MARCNRRAAIVTESYQTLAAKRDYEVNRYEYELLPVCQTIHSAFNGASDPLDANTLETYIKFLRMRIENWIPCKETYREFDTAVLSLCLIAMTEALTMQTSNNANT